MKKANQTEQTIDNEKFSAEQNGAQDGQTTNCEDASCDNVTDKEQQLTDNSSAGDAQVDVAAEVAEWKDKYLRLQAEFDNYRKRTLKEKMDLVAAGGEDVLKEMLCVVDDMDRAQASMAASDNIDSIREGVELIARKLSEVMRAKGVSEIEAVGLPLDTDLHEAVAKFPVDAERKGLIIDVVQKGYKLKDKVIRYAKVVVGE